MLSSITPLGQRGRGASWFRTVSFFWLGAVLAAGLVYGAIGATGELLSVADVGPVFAVVVFGVAAALDLAGVAPVGPKRQVNEDWLGRYRDWVVGFGFGGQLAVGWLTIVRTWGVWALVVASFVEGLPGAVLIGVGFALGRSLPLVAARSVSTSDRLKSLMRRFDRLRQAAQAALYFGYVAVVAIGGAHVA